LSNQGFRVFRYPAGQSNGFPEVTRRSARFITNSASLVAFEQHFARIVNNLGYDIDLIPTTEGIQESAGLHCNTNEMRVSH
jgi:hypothetical protein